jgi:hypothetical protein
MVRVDTAPVMTSMANDLIPVGCEAVANTKDEPIGSILPSMKPQLSRLGRSSDDAAIPIHFSIGQQLFDPFECLFVVMVKDIFIPCFKTISYSKVGSRTHTITSIASSAWLTGSS